jgi:hypothetical protein
VEGGEGLHPKECGAIKQVNGVNVSNAGLLMLVLFLRFSSIVAVFATDSLFFCSCVLTVANLEHFFPEDFSTFGILWRRYCVM